MFLLWYAVYSLQAVRYANGDTETILHTWRQCCHDFSLSPHNIQRDSKRWTQFHLSFGWRACTSCRRYGLNSKRRLNTRQTVGCGIPSSLHALPVDLRGLRSKLLNSSHVLLWYTWSARAFAFTQTAYVLKLVVPMTNALPHWRVNVETKTKRTLHSSRRLSFNELTNAKNLVLHSSHFALNWRCCKAVR